MLRSKSLSSQGQRVVTVDEMIEEVQAKAVTVCVLVSV